MRSYPLYTILLLCLVILVVDILAFYWLLSITELISIQSIKIIIYCAFWLFTIGLVSAIIILKTRLDKIHLYKKQVFTSSLYGLVVSSLVPKFIFVVIISILNLSNYAFSEKESFIVIPILGLFSGFLPFFVILYAVFHAVHQFKVHKTKVRCDRLPEGLKGIKKGKFRIKNFLVYDLARCLETGELWKNSKHILRWSMKIKSTITGVNS